MQQVVDLQNDPDFQALDVEIVSIALDSAAEQTQGQREYGITDVPMLVDADRRMSEAYDVMKWAVGTGEPGHTFILVGADGKIKWIRDYGAPENGGLMYVPVPELTAQIAFTVDN
jgi:peroxiredoxin